MGNNIYVYIYIYIYIDIYRYIDIGICNIYIYIYTYVVSLYFGLVPPLPWCSSSETQDITGEAPFMKTSAEMYDAKAKENKALRLDLRRLRQC